MFVAVFYTLKVIGNRYFSLILQKNLKTDTNLSNLILA